MTLPLPPAPSRAELVDHLVRTRIAGNVATPRENNLSHYRSLANGDRHYWLGLELGDRWADEQDVLAVMAERCGVDDDPEFRRGQDTIDPELTVDALDRAAALLRKLAATGTARGSAVPVAALGGDGADGAGAEREGGAVAGAGDGGPARPGRVLLATGHPGGLLDVHRAVGTALRRAGVEVVRVPLGLYADEGVVVQFGGVAVHERGASLWHTHSPRPMTQILDALEREGQPPPDLVFADHGWAGCAAQRGIDAVGFADCNDPALFLAEAEGTLSVAVPLDDHVLDPRFYEPMTAYLLEAAGLWEIAEG